MVLNTSMSHKLDIFYYNVDDRRDPINKYKMDSIKS